MFWLTMQRRQFKVWSFHEPSALEPDYSLAHLNLILDKAQSRVSIPQKETFNSPLPDIDSSVQELPNCFCMRILEQMAV